MINSQLILEKKAKILPELINWIETFNPENIIYDKNRIEEDEEEDMYKTYDYLNELTERLKHNRCTDKDFEVILFQIKQINHNKIIVDL